MTLTEVKQKSRKVTAFVRKGNQKEIIVKGSPYKVFESPAKVEKFRGKFKKLDSIIGTYHTSYLSPEFKAVHFMHLAILNHQTTLFSNFKFLLSILIKV